MANQFDVIVGIDPGVSGGISIVYKNGVIDVNRIPVRKITVNKKDKKVYDLSEIRKILEPHQNKKVLFIQERVSAMPGNGNVSMFGFGKSAGSTIGMAVGLGFKVIEVGSATWKKHYPQLVTDGIRDKKESIKKIRALGKTLKDKKAKKANKKEIDKINRQVKTIAKKEARKLASLLYPNSADEFKKENSDGIAESLLIALFGRDKQNELV